MRGSAERRPCRRARSASPAAALRALPLTPALSRSRERESEPLPLSREIPPCPASPSAPAGAGSCSNCRRRPRTASAAILRSYAAGPQLWGAIEAVAGERARPAPTGPSWRPPTGSPCATATGVTGAMRLALGPRRFAIRHAADPDGPRRGARLPRRGDHPVSEPDPGAARRDPGAAAPTTRRFVAAHGRHACASTTSRRARRSRVYAVFGEARAKDWSDRLRRGPRPGPRDRRLGEARRLARRAPRRRAHRRPPRTMRRSPSTATGSSRCASPPSRPPGTRRPTSPGSRCACAR